MGEHEEIQGLEQIDKVVDIDQRPIGRTPRSNPAAYTKVFDDIRDLFGMLPESRVRGYQKGRFSFNVKGGRQFKAHSIADVLDLSVAQAAELFEDLPLIRRTLETLLDVGLGYLKLGQAATTMSGGEAQRIKLARELARRNTGRTLYILDEPTTGLHFADIKRLLSVLQRLVGAGNTVVVIEHILDVIKVADWLIDLGPEGGAAGGRIVGKGSPESVARLKGSHTGRFLVPVLARGRGGAQPRKVR